MVNSDNHVCVGGASECWVEDDVDAFMLFDSRWQGMGLDLALDWSMIPLALMLAFGWRIKSGRLYCAVRTLVNTIPKQR